MSFMAGVMIGAYVRWWFDVADFRFNRRYEFALAAIRGDCRDKEYSRLYSFKALICLALNLESGEERFRRDDIVAGVLNYTGPHGEYSSYDWDEIRVGLGIFTGWYYSLEWDSSA